MSTIRIDTKLLKLSMAMELGLKLRELIKVLKTNQKLYRKTIGYQSLPHETTHHRLKSTLKLRQNQ